MKTVFFCSSHRHLEKERGYKRCKRRGEEEREESINRIGERLRRKMRNGSTRSASQGIFR
jgi:hypothetical protein